MRPIHAEVVSVFRGALEGVLRTAGIAEVPMVAISEANPKFGDYQCNNAMGLFKQFKTQLGARSPKDIADRIVAEIPSVDMFSKIDVAPQGFITVSLSSDWLKQFSLIPLDEAGVARFVDPHPKRVVVDFSSPNIAKEMHVGHLRSTILGETVSRVLEDVGHEVTRLNHVGDWGTQFGMLIEYIKELYPDFLTNQPDVRDLEGFYKAAKKRFDDDEDFKERARLRVVTLQSGDEFSIQAWKVLCAISRAEFDKIYQRLGITLTERGESYYNEMLPSVLAELANKGLIEESKGAKIIRTKIDEVPLMAQKTDGGYGYDSTDLAAVRHRIIKMGADWVVYFTDVGQEGHFLKIFDAAEQAGWHDPPRTRLDHAGFGMVLGEDGKRFRTRSTETVKLMDLLDEASTRAEATLREKMAMNPEKPHSEEWIKSTAEALGMAAVRYYDMRSSRLTNYVFNYNEMLDPHGNTAVYSMYAYARICSIIAKAEEIGVPVDQLTAAHDLSLMQSSERDLALWIAKFPDVISDLLEDIMPHRLTAYTFELSNKFSAFYRDCKVIGAEEMQSRLVLLRLTKSVMGKCLYYLGITPLESM